VKNITILFSVVNLYLLLSEVEVNTLNSAYCRLGKLSVNLAHTTGLLALTHSYSLHALRYRWCC